MAGFSSRSVKILEALALLGLAAPAFAEPPRDDGLPARPQQQGARAQERAASPRTSDLLGHMPLCPLRLPRLADLDPEPESLLRQVTLSELPPGSLQIEYRGVQGFIARRLQSRYRSLWRGQIDLWYDETALSDAERNAALTELGWAFADLRTGRWWERSWLDSRLPEKGGAPATPWVHTEGEALEVFRVGRVRLTNELKLRVDRVGELSLDADPGLVYRAREEIETPTRVARDHARLARAMRDPEDDGRRPPLTEDGAVGQLPVLAPMVAIELAPAQRIFMEGVSWRVKLRPSLRFKVPDDFDPNPVELLRSLTLRFSADMHLGQSELEVLSVELGVTYSPEDHQVDVRAQLALVAW